jgi:lysophospholipid acyltransferase
MKMLTANWNIYTALWLKRTVYTRFNSKNKTLANIFTYFISGFWHGFYPGYYLSFLSGAIVTSAGRSIRRNIRPIFTTPNSPLADYKRIYDFVGILFTVGCTSYVFTPAAIKDWDGSIRLWKDTYFIGHILCFSALFLFDILKLGNMFQKTWIKSVNDSIIKNHKD